MKSRIENRMKNIIRHIGSMFIYLVGSILLMMTTSAFADEQAKQVHNLYDMFDNFSTFGREALALVIVIAALIGFALIIVALFRAHKKSKPQEGQNVSLASILMPAIIGSLLMCSMALPNLLSNTFVGKDSGVNTQQVAQDTNGFITQ